MPAKGKTRITGEQRILIAQGRVTGKSHREVAAQTGLAIGTVTNQGVDARTLTLCQELKARHERRLTKLFEKELAGLDHNLGLAKARKDPQTFLRACNVTNKIILDGDPEPRRIDPARSREGG